MVVPNRQKARDACLLVVMAGIGACKLSPCAYSFAAVSRNIAKLAASY